MLSTAIEVCSLFELTKAILIGYKNIIFVGSGKSIDELELCIASNMIL